MRFLLPPIRDKESSFSLKKVSIKAQKEDCFSSHLQCDNQANNKKTILMELVSKVAEICCIADDFCREYELEMKRMALFHSPSSCLTLKRRQRKAG